MPYIFLNAYLRVNLVYLLYILSDDTTKGYYSELYTNEKIKKKEGNPVVKITHYQKNVSNKILQK